MSYRTSSRLSGHGDKMAPKRNERSLRHQTPEVQDYLQSLKRGRGRPKKRLVVTKRPTNVGLNQTQRQNRKNRKVTQYNGFPIITFSNSEPPHLMPQTLDIDERLNAFPNVTQNDDFADPALPSINEFEDKGKLCSHYLKNCVQLTNEIESQNLAMPNLMTILKYALIKSNLGHIENSINALKSASEDINVGLQYDFEETLAKRNGQPTDQRHNWSGRRYTPKPNYGLK